MNRWRRIFFVVMASFLVVSCSARNSEFKTSADLSQPTGFNREYRLQAGDEIEVKFFMSPELNQEVIVRPDGKISLQLLDDVAAVGLTPDELARAITEGYRTELREPRITVVVKRLAAKVYVGGEVRQPRFVPLTGSMTMLQAIFEAGGFTDTAEPSSVILLRRLNQEKGIAAKIDLKKVISAEAEDLALTPSDVIYIPKSTIAEVNLFVEQYITKLIPVPISVPVPTY
jgi:protein involved in polysaccharide export with SLBB domain